MTWKGKNDECRINTWVNKPNDVGPAKIQPIFKSTVKRKNKKVF